MGFLFKKIIVSIAFFGIMDTLFAEEGLRVSSAPYISGDTFRSYADHIFDETIDIFDPRSVRFGEVVFVKGDMLERFFAEKHRYILVPYVLVCHNSDEAMPGKFARYVEDPKILQWFAQNIEGWHNGKLRHLPIGLANRCWQHGSIRVVNRVRQLLYQNNLENQEFIRFNDKENKRTHLVYLNIATGTYPEERQRVYDLFHKELYCYSPPWKSFEGYLKDLALSKFVLSPRGNGIDCHRTWEALYMGAVPIVKTSSLDYMYEGLPVVIVQDWSEVTEEFLNKTYEEMSQVEFNIEKLTALYWYHEFHKYKATAPHYNTLPFHPTEEVDSFFPKEPLDVVIPCVEKDLKVLHHCIASVRRYCQNIRNIYLISSKPFTDEVEWFDETLYPFSKEDVALALTKSPLAAKDYLNHKQTRCGWFYQQLLKLYAPFVIPGISSNILVVDADVIFLKPVTFQDTNGAPLFNVSFEYHLPYFGHIRRLLPGLTRVLPKYSGISHHMLFQRPILEKLFQTVERLHGKAFWQAFCHEVSPKDVWFSGASEYEVYFNYVMTLFPLAKVRRLRAPDIGRLEEIPRCIKENSDYAACHAYNAPPL